MARGSFLFFHTIQNKSAPMKGTSIRKKCYNPQLIQRKIAQTYGLRRRNKFIAVSKSCSFTVNGNILLHTDRKNTHYSSQPTRS